MAIFGIYLAFVEKVEFVFDSGVQDPDFGVQSGRIIGLFWIWIGLDIVSLSTGSIPEYPNEIKCGHAKKS